MSSVFKERERCKEQDKMKKKFSWQKLPIHAKLYPLFFCSCWKCWEDEGTNICEKLKYYQWKRWEEERLEGEKTTEFLWY